MPKTLPQKRDLFLLGAAAPLSVYVVFYASHATALLTDLEDFYTRFGFFGIATTLTLFLGVAALCGGWALLCDSRSYKAAFSAGLGLPALILSGSGAFAPSVESAFRQPADPVRMASLSPVPILAAAESGALLKAFSLVFNPVGTVVEGRTMALQHRTQALQRQTTGLQETNMFLLLQHQTIRSQVASLEGKVKVLRQENAEAQARETSARANALVLKKHVAEVQAAVAARDARILEFDTKAAGMAQAVNGLTQELADAQRALAASTGARDIQQREIRQLNTTVERQAQALADCDRLLSGLASAAGLKSVDLLNEGLRSARAPESRISIIKAIGAVPRATERADIRNQLQTLERTGPADVQRAAKGVLNR